MFLMDQLRSSNADRRRRGALVAPDLGGVGRDLAAGELALQISLSIVNRSLCTIRKRALTRLALDASL